MRTSFERSFLAGIGLLSMTRDKAQKIVDELTQRGEVQRDEAKDWADQLVQRGEEERQSLRKLIRDEVKSALDGMGLATKQDLHDLTARVEALGQQDKV